jgi:3-phenylpropionate/cinnamic acid dioxygenase small subunit
VSDPTSRAETAEAVRAAIASYAQALDDGRTDDVVATFCPDGEVDIPGLGAHRGHDEIRAAFAAVEPKSPQRHLVLNTLITSWGDDEVRAVSDLVFLAKQDNRWSVAMVGRYHDTLHRDGETWRFHQRRAEFH